jgi:uncharacterized protein (DUF983 family)
MQASTSSATATVAQHPELRDLPERGWSRLCVLLARSVKRRCPMCGAPGIFKGWFTLRSECPRCGYVFARESGYFLGSYPLNLIAAEIVPVALMVALLVWTDLSWIWMEVLLIPLAVGLPFLLYPFAQMIWMAIDLYLTPVNQR